MLGWNLPATARRGRQLRTPLGEKRADDSDFLQVIAEHAVIAELGEEDSSGGSEESGAEAPYQP